MANTITFNGKSYNIHKSIEPYFKLCMIGLTTGITLGGFIGLTIAAASPIIGSVYAVRVARNIIARK